MKTIRSLTIASVIQGIAIIVLAFGLSHNKRLATATAELNILMFDQVAKGDSLSIANTALILNLYDAKGLTPPRYPNVELLNAHYADSLRALHYHLPVTYYEWEETANALDVPIDSLTVDLFFHHLTMHDE